MHNLLCYQRYYLLFLYYLLFYFLRLTIDAILKILLEKPKMILSLLALHRPNLKKPSTKEKKDLFNKFQIMEDGKKIEDKTLNGYICQKDGKHIYLVFNIKCNFNSKLVFCFDFLSNKVLKLIIQLISYLPNLALEILSVKDNQTYI